MCYVSYQIDRYLAAQDREDAREWLGMKGEDDSYGRYQFDAAEQLDGTLSAADNTVLEDFGMEEGWNMLSSAGKEVIKDRALDLAIEDGFSRYEE
jgi:hypothetical protein